ncbi:hypothetical protein D3Y55_15765 [Mesorhizobium sp. DCY119]|jgi:hypothetical protein|nr:hypothetical protein D3Y55_15765 [Mesorhizobium sp. DCY119]
MLHRRVLQKHHKRYDVVNHAAAPTSIKKPAELALAGLRIFLIQNKKAGHAPGSFDHCFQ